MIRLYIKGDASAARAALDARGLLTTSALDPRSAITVATVHESDLPAVIAWFCDLSTAAVEGEGFPAGTLLYYN